MTQAQLAEVAGLTPVLSKDKGRGDLRVSSLAAQARQLDLQALCLDVHHEAGFVVPQYHRYDADGLHFPAIERLDRDAEGLPVPMGSLFSVIATGSRMQDVGSLAPDTVEQLYKRILIAQRIPSGAIRGIYCDPYDGTLPLPGQQTTPRDSAKSRCRWADGSNPENNRYRIG